ncbi:hypothetical protein [Mycoplasmopsis lipofaciens]|nr:hypothetical protein [Mycoplasmopsis lipofaciens]
MVETSETKIGKILPFVSIFSKTNNRSQLKNKLYEIFSNMLTKYIDV